MSVNGCMHSPKRPQFGLAPPPPPPQQPDFGTDPRSQSSLSLLPNSGFCFNIKTQFYFNFRQQSRSLIIHTMKTLGLLGGMSWESTVTYYQQINRRVREVRGGLHSAKCVVLSFDFAEIAALQHAGRWDKAGVQLDDAAVRLRLAGADAIVVCTNTMHMVAGGIAAAAQRPLIHIVDPTAEAIRKAGFKAPGLLGTRFTMEKDFYKDKLHEHGLQVVIPNEEDREIVHTIIYEELCNGIVKEESRQAYTKVIQNLAAAGADCLILGCTEIGLLINKSSSALPIFDTAELHAVAAADWAMADE